jgi:hypothetical protein
VKIKPGDKIWVRGKGAGEVISMSTLWVVVLLDDGQRELPFTWDQVYIEVTPDPDHMYVPRQ